MKNRFATLAAVLIQIVPASLSLGQILSHGPVVGGVTDSSAKVFVRTSKASSVVLRYGTDPTMATYRNSDTFDTKIASDFTEIIPLAELAAETTYYLDVVVGDIAQLVPPYPSFTTFAPSRVRRNFSFVVLSDFTDADKLTDRVQTFASAAAAHPSFVFIGGDFDHRNPTNLLSKRRMFQQLYDPNTRGMADFVTLILHKMPIIHQWDDHDAGENNLDKNYAGWPLSQQAFQEYVPSYPLPAITPGIWQKFSYAQADFFVLDCRSQRDPEDDPDDVDKSMLDGNTLGATGELQWLENGLLNSTAKWKVIFTSVITNPTTKVPDGWGGYQTEWNGLRDFITTNRIQGVVFISGDLHLGAIDNGTHGGFPEMCVPSPNGNETGLCPTDAPGRWSEGYYDATCTGYGLVSISEKPAQLVLQVADQFGNIQLSYTVPRK